MSFCVERGLPYHTESEPLESAAQQRHEAVVRQLLRHEGVAGRLEAALLKAGEQAHANVQSYPLMTSCYVVVAEGTISCYTPRVSTIHPT